MDENQTEENEIYSKTSSYVQLFSTALAVGMFIGGGVVVGQELTRKTQEKIKKIRTERSIKKNNS